MIAEAWEYSPMEREQWQSKTTS